MRTTWCTCLIGAWLVGPAQFERGLAAATNDPVASAPSLLQRPANVGGLEIQLTLDKAAIRMREPVEASILLRCTSTGHLLYNPFFDGLLELPGQIVVRNADGRLVNTLPGAGLSRRGVKTGDHVWVPRRGSLGCVLVLHPGLATGFHRPLGPGTYSLQLEVFGSLLSFTGESNRAVIATSEPVTLRLLR